MPRDERQVSEVGQLLAEIAPSLPEQTQQELLRLLGHSVAMPSKQELREMRLGLLVEMVSEGELPGVVAYDELRATRNSTGATWPGSTTLILHYGTWAAATRGAVDLAFDVTGGRIRATSPRPWPLAPYTRKEILDALTRSSKKVGQVIGQWEYVELRRVERNLAATSGAPDPRLPDLRVISRSFGNWDRAISQVAP
jgi:hypothetical protein